MVNTISFRARLILLPERLNKQYGVDGLRIRTSWAQRFSVASSKGYEVYV